MEQGKRIRVFACVGILLALLLAGGLGRILVWAWGEEFQPFGLSVCHIPNATYTHTVWPRTLNVLEELQNQNRTYEYGRAAKYP